MASVLEENINLVTSSNSANIINKTTSNQSLEMTGLNNFNTIVNSSSSLGNSESIEDLIKEGEMLKQKLEEERAKFNDVERNLRNNQ